MIADLAESGAKLLLRKPDWQLDDTLRLELHIALGEHQEPRIAMGQVVRIEPLPDEKISLWTHQVGVEFHSPIALSDEDPALAETEVLETQRRRDRRPREAPGAVRQEPSDVTGVPAFER